MAAAEQKPGAPLASPQEGQAFPPPFQMLSPPQGFQYFSQAPKLAQLPDLESIKKQTEAHQKNLDEKFELEKQFAEQNTKQRKEQLRYQAEKELAIFKAQQDQHTKQQELIYDQELARQIMELQQDAFNKKAMLEDQAARLTMEFHQAKIGDELKKKEQDIANELVKKNTELQKERGDLQKQMQQAFGPLPFANALPMDAQQQMDRGLVPPPQVTPTGSYVIGPCQTVSYVLPSPSTPRTIGVGTPRSSSFMAGAPSSNGVSYMGPPQTAQSASLLNPKPLTPSSSGAVLPPTVYAAPLATYATTVAGSPASAFGASPIDSVFNAIDRNQDGVISRTEWNRAMMG